MKISRLFLISVFIIGLYSNNSLAECTGRFLGYKPCNELFNSTQQNQLFEELLNQSTLGNETANFKLGMMFEFGIYVSKNIDKANYYYLKAANGNVVLAQFIVGLGYLNGYGLKKDLDAALFWFVRSANSGHAKSMYNAAKIIMESADVSKYYLVIDYLEGASVKGNLNSLALLSRIYFDGVIVNQDIHKALHYLNLSSEGGDVASMAVLAVFYIEGKFVDKNPRLGWKLMEKAASAGSIYAIEYIELNGGSNDKR
ncbi:tetratricopeptide repeat protein [Photobacterium sp. J15]|uniref:tetratricopeptide repeat protein n=1 Tax=Photobacterium sp. J15 TaxID=265901 RepID=UPI0007E38124|nr:SEL1-like repeat protein [Photobacterium sp. J15]